MGLNINNSIDEDSRRKNTIKSVWGECGYRETGQWWWHLKESCSLNSVSQQVAVSWWHVSLSWRQVFTQGLCRINLRPHSLPSTYSLPPFLRLSFSYFSSPFHPSLAHPTTTRHPWASRANFSDISSSRPTPNPTSKLWPFSSSRLLKSHRGG